MSEALRPGDQQASSSQVRRIDEACLRFEDAYQAGQQPSIEEYLQAVPEPERAPLLRELLALELAYRSRKGDTLAPSEYQKRFPEYSELILDIFREEIPLAVPRSSDEESSQRSADTYPWPAGEGQADPSSRLGRYRITAKLGSGAFGVVYKGYDEQLRREVAIKMPPAAWVASAENVESFQAEARVLASLDHPGIVPIYDVGQTEDGRCYLVSKFVPDKDLKARLRAARPSTQEAVEMIAQVAEALHYAHQQGLVHRDIKPANILLDAVGRPVVADFGLALRQEDFGTGTGFAGTPAYMSPEQARGEGHRVDARSDVYSLGVVFYELLTGQLPFRDVKRHDLLEQIKNQEPRPPRQLDDRIPNELDRICLKALAKRARDRYSTAIDLAQDLRHWQRGEPEKPAVNVQVMLPPGVPLGPSFLLPQPEAAEGNPRQLQVVSKGTPSAQTATFDSNKGPTRVVPKGLRSFDAEDADFFLELLPGPCDRDGLPESIRFWKTRIEALDPDRTFSVGLLYGPSGCGKSSLVKAGLLPRLADHVLPVYVEATAAETESRLLKGLRKRLSGLPDDARPVETLTSLRRNPVPSRQRDPEAGTKVLLVLDQFEQWLHAQREQPSGDLVEALRQCDGQRVQCLILVRDDFGMAITRLMRELEIPILEGQNFATVDLFDPRHARKVLAKFGRSFGALPANPAKTTPEQERFLDEAIAGLCQDGKVISVRLALFAEMVKAKPWTPATLKQVGGTEGLGVAFLEEMFGARSANPEHHVHQKAVRAVLQALLPEHGTDLKGHMRSHEELLQASGYDRRPKDFDDVIRILDTELRLVTPTDPQGLESEEDTRAVASAKRYYQLTHDYLVPALRHWLTRKQRETWRGRAELRLAERAALWSARPETRQLPSWWEWWNIELFTRKAEWTRPQHKMMRSATRHHAIRTIAVAIVLLGIGIAGAAVRRNLDFQHADQLVDRLFDVEMSQVPKMVADIQEYRHWASQRLQNIVADPNSSDKKRLRARLALLPQDPGQAKPLSKDLLRAAKPEEFFVIRDQLNPPAPDLLEQLWNLLEDGQAERDGRFRAACALAHYEPKSPRWERVGPVVASKLVSENSLLVGEWSEALRPINGILLEPLADIILDRSRPESERDVASNIIADYAAAHGGQRDPPAPSLADHANLLARLVLQAEPRQCAMLLPTLLAHDKAVVIPLMQQKLDSKPEPEMPEAERDNLAKEQANAAVVMIRLGEKETVWPLFRHRSDSPALRTYLIHRLGPLKTPAEVIIHQLDTQPHPSELFALILSLGEFPEDILPKQERRNLVPKLLEVYRQNPDAGVHSAVEWLLRYWQQGPELSKVLDDRIFKKPDPGRGWYVNRWGQTMAIIAGHAHFWMGSPDDEPDRTPEAETLHVERIPRTFAIATKEVTIREFKKFLEAYPRIQKNFPPFGRDEDKPVMGVTWFQAAQYCRWLSDCEGVPADQLCYPSVEEMQTSLEEGKALNLPPEYLVRTGYRLPTEAEWEYASRVGARSTWFFGSSEEMLPKYAWYLSNCKGAKPVGLLKPNDFGVFDVYGNAAEWTHAWALGYSTGTLQQPHVDQGEDAEVHQLQMSGILASAPQGPLRVLPFLDMKYIAPPRELRIFRGGAYVHPTSHVRSAARFLLEPDRREPFMGFRVARTHH